MGRIKLDIARGMGVTQFVGFSLKSRILSLWGSRNQRVYPTYAAKTTNTFQYKALIGNISINKLFKHGN